MTDLLLQIGAEFPGADKVNEQLNKLDRSLDESVKAANRFEREIKRLNAAKKKGTVTDQGYNAALQQSVARLLDTSSATERQTQSLQRNVQATERATQATNRKNAAQQAARTQFLATANSIAVLDGPLGGVASRFSAFGVLIGRIGIPLAAFSVGMTTLGVVINRAVREFSSFETSMARINSMLELTGNRAGLTSSQIQGLSESIAASTLQSSQAVREAAAQLLTFGSIAGDTFGEVLNLAADMAALGFGTLQSESLKLAKAIEDPRQSLASLSRSGITFTRDQRAVILSLIETGRAAEATARILETVRDQVGGAASREAETFAGSIDTIRQAYGILFRTLGEKVAGEGRLVRLFFDELARRATVIVESETPFTDSEDIRRGIEELEQLNNIVEINRESIENLQNLIQQGKIEPDIGVQAILSLRKATSDAEKRIESLTTKVGDGLVQGLTASEIASKNLSEALSEVESSIRTAVLDTGLSSLESYIQSAIRAANATAAIEENVDGLGDAFIKTKTIEFVVKQAAALENNLRRATDAFQDSNAAAQAQLEFIGRTGREVQVLRSIREQQLRVEADILRLEEQKKGASEEQVRLLEQQQQGLRDQLQSYEQAAESARQLAAASDEVEAAQRAAADEATRFSSVINGSQSVIDAAKSRVEGLAAEVEALANGADRYAANIARGLALQRAANREAVAGISDPAQRIAATAELAIQQAELNAVLQQEADLLRQRDEILTGGRGDSGGGGGGQAGRIEQLHEEIEAMRMRLDLTRDFMEEERIQQEEFFAEQQSLLDDALREQIVSYEEHYRLQQLLKEEHEREMANIARQARMAEIGGFSDFMGSMASIAQQGGSQLERISQVFAAAQALSKAYQMAVGAGADTPGPIWVRLAAYASALSTGLGAVSAIRGGGSSSSSGRAVSRAAPADVSVPSREMQQAPQRVIVQGLDPNALFSGEQIQNLFESFYQENDNRGRVFVVQR